MPVEFSSSSDEDGGRLSRDLRRSARRRQREIRRDERAIATVGQQEARESAEVRFAGTTIERRAGTIYFPGRGIYTTIQKAQADPRAFFGDPTRRVANRPRVDPAGVTLWDSATNAVVTLDAADPRGFYIFAPNLALRSATPNAAVVDVAPLDAVRDTVAVRGPSFDDEPLLSRRLASFTAPRIARATVRSVCSDGALFEDDRFSLGKALCVQTFTGGRCVMWRSGGSSWAATSNDAGTALDVFFFDDSTLLHGFSVAFDSSTSLWRVVFSGIELDEYTAMIDPIFNWCCAQLQSNQSRAALPSAGGSSLHLFNDYVSLNPLKSFCVVELRMDNFVFRFSPSAAGQSDRCVPARGPTFRTRGTPTAVARLAAVGGVRLFFAVGFDTGVIGVLCLPLISDGGELVCHGKAGFGPVTAVACNPCDATTFFSATENGSVFYWDCKALMSAAHFDGPTKQIQPLQTIREGHSLHAPTPSVRLFPPLFTRFHAVFLTLVGVDAQPTVEVVALAGWRRVHTFVLAATPDNVHSFACAACVPSSLVVGYCADGVLHSDTVELF